MNSHTKALANSIDHGPARRRVARWVQATAFIGVALLGAVSCGDGSRVTGPSLQRYQSWPAKTVLDSAPAPAELKASKTLPRIGGVGSSAPVTTRLLTASTSRGPASGTSATLSSSAALDPAPLVATPVPFKYEPGPFRHPLSACEDCLLGEQDANGNATGNGFPIGFDFTFYGNTYKEFYVSTNGFIAFTPGTYDGCCAGGLIPEAYEPNNIIAAAWSDLKYDEESDAGKISYETRGTAPHRRLIVDFNGVSMWSDVNEKISAQIVLYEGTNAIEIYTKSNHAQSNSLTQGVENANGTAAAFLEGRVQSVFNLDNDGVRFSNGAVVPNNAPTVSPGGNAGGPPADRYEGVEGKPVKFAATGADADGDALTYAWDFNGDGQVDAETAQAEYAFNDNGKFTAKVTVSDGKDVATAAVEVVVANVAPTAGLTVSESVDEGSPIAVSVDFVDDAADDALAPFEFAFDCGDGNGFGAYGQVASASCVTVDDGQRTVGVKVRDKDGGESVYTRVVGVRNVAPVVSAVPRVSAKSGQVINLSGWFSDAGANDRLWKWSWSDGTLRVSSAAQGVVGSSSGNSAEQGAVAGEYRACAAGEQQLTLEVVDKDGARGTATATVVVEPYAAQMQVKPDWVALSASEQDVDAGGELDDRWSDTHGRVVTVYLFSTPDFDATAIDLASVRLTNGSGKGTPVAVKRGKKTGSEWEVKYANLNGDRLRDVKLRFSRNALIANGDLTLGTTSLSLTGRIGTCVSVTATAPVQVK